MKKKRIYRDFDHYWREGDHGWSNASISICNLALKSFELEKALAVANEALNEIQCLKLGGLDMSNTKFNAMVTKLSFKIADQALDSLRKSGAVKQDDGIVVWG